MLETNTDYNKKEAKIRRKKLLRLFREDQQARIWNAVMDEVGSCDLTALGAECDSFDFLDPLTDPEFEDPDEDYQNKAETLHNLFECD
jgi:hypothetical protein